VNIGEAAEASGVSAKMIRYYEQVGLIPPVDRTASGYRAYSRTEVNVLHFIRRARDLGFSVDEIGELLELWRDRSRQSAEVKRIARSHIAELQQKIENLQQMKNTLQSLIDCCAGDERPDCPILADLETPQPSEPRSTARKGAVSRRKTTRDEKGGG
jgi:MerR family transcriptional regulator, gold-responsive activator of gol and ges genes